MFKIKLKRFTTIFLFLIFFEFLFFDPFNSVNLYFIPYDSVKDILFFIIFSLLASFLFILFLKDRENLNLEKHKTGRLVLKTFVSSIVFTLIMSILVVISRVIPELFIKGPDYGGEFGIVMMVALWTFSAFILGLAFFVIRFIFYKFYHNKILSFVSLALLCLSVVLVFLMFGNYFLKSDCKFGSDLKCVAEKITASENLSLCEKVSRNSLINSRMKNAYMVNDCYFEVSKNWKDINLCKQINDIRGSLKPSNQRLECITNITVNTKL